MEPSITRYRFLLLFLVAAIGWQGSGDAGERKSDSWVAGSYAFSDELGGFKIVGISGRGTQSDPIILQQDLYSTGKSVLTIRLVNPANVTNRYNASWITLHIRFHVLNRSNAGWIGYRFELQEDLGKASIYGDGLSFNQLTRDESQIHSSRFRRYEIEHEPGDRLTFNDGWVDTSQQVDFSVFLLDLTPAQVFYIEQVPILPFS